MQYTVNRGEKGKVEVKVEVPKAAFEQSYGEFLKALGKDMKVAGFRPGNVPTDVLEGKVGISKILNETASHLASKNLADIFKKENIVPLGNPSIAVETLSKGFSFKFTAVLTDKPKAKIGDWKKIKVKKVAAKEVTAADIDESIKNVYEAWQARKSDVGGQKSDSGGAGDDQKSGKFIYDAHGNKIFLKEEGEKVSQLSNVSQDKIDDEFAKAIGARDVAHLKELVKRDLEKIMIDQVEAKLEQELFDELLKIGDVDVPDILIDDEINRIILRITQNLESQGKKLEDLLKEENTTLDGLKAKLRPQAEKNVKITLMMDEIGKSEKVEVGEEEIENAYKGVDTSKLSESQKQDLRNYLMISIFQAKTLELVKKSIAA